MEYAMNVLNKLFEFNINTTAFCLSRYSIHLLLLKSSMTEVLVSSIAFVLIELKRFYGFVSHARTKWNKKGAGILGVFNVDKNQSTVTISLFYFSVVYLC